MFNSGVTFLNFGSSQSQVPAVTQADVSADDRRQPRQEEPLTCIPVTVRAVEQGLAQTADRDEFRVHGVEPGMIVLVGAVENMSKPGGVSLEFTLNDGTGRMRVRYFLTEEGAMQGLEGMSSGCYVSIVGQARKAPSPHISVTCMNLVSSADEVSYHMVEAAHAFLKLQKGPSTSVELRTPAKQRPAEAVDITPLSPPKDEKPKSYQATATVSASVLGQHMPLKPDLRQLALNFVKRDETGPEGAALSDIVAHLAPAGATEVRLVLEGLQTDGEIYNSIDENHFSAL